MNCFSACGCFQDRQDNLYFVTALSLPRGGYKMEQSQLFGNGLKRSKNITIELESKAIDQIESESHLKMAISISASKRITIGGHDVKRPQPHLGHPQFLLVKTQR